MELKLVDRLVLIGIAFVGIGNMLYSTTEDAYKIQRDVIMDMNDVLKLEDEVEERKRKNDQQLMFKGYTFVLKG